MIGANFWPLPPRVPIDSCGPCADLGFLRSVRLADEMEVDEREPLDQFGEDEADQPETSRPIEPARIEHHQTHPRPRRPLWRDYWDGLISITLL
jgi:hypothetical protein